MKLLSLCLAAALPICAQLPTPNTMGVSAGHDVLRAKDVAAANQFFVTLGGELVPFVGTNMLVRFHGVLLLNVGNGPNQAKGKGAPTPPPPPTELLGSEGSSLDFMGFSVKDLKAALAKWADAGIKPLPGGTSKEVFVMSPDKIKIRITEDSKQATPIAAGTIKMVVPDVKAAQAWYEKNFGAKQAKVNGETVFQIPGSNIIFEQAKGPVAPSKGRAFDRIGLEIVDMESFAKKLEANGVKFDSPYRYTESMKAGFAVLTDPFGTQIELSQGLAAMTK